MSYSIKYVEHNNIDFNKWDECVNTSKTELIYGSSVFLNIMHPGFHALVVNDYESVFPVTSAKKYGIQYVYQPYFTQQLGLIGLHEDNSNLLDECIKHLLIRYKYIECNFNIHNNSKEFKQYCSKQISVALDLNQSFEQVKTQYSKNLKRNLAKAGQQNLIITQDVSVDGIIKLFKENRGASLKHLKDVHYNRLIKLLNTISDHNKLIIYGIKSQNDQLNAAVVFLKNKNKYIFFFSALNEFGKEHSLMPFLISYFIESRCSKPSVLDFMGSNQPNLARFYKSFGASEYVYLRLKLNQLPWPLKLFKN